MHKCIVCGNLSSKTNINRSGVVYHGIPKNVYMRRKWLKVFGIDHCYDWQRVCSDHFLEKDYKPKTKRFLYSNTIPQPYERKSVTNGFPSNYATQNNEILPKEQIVIKEEHNKNAVEDKFVLPRRSPRHKNMMVYTLGSGLLCSVKNCRNRFSKSLSLFGYPKDLNLRIKWMEKCGLKKDPAKIVISTVRVCGIHFEDDCFKNIELRNRLKPGSIPSLFLGDDTTDTINIPSTSPRDDIKTEKNMFDGMVKCYGRNGFVSDECIGYFQNNSKDTYMCCGCSWSVINEDLLRKDAIIKSLESKIAERTIRVMALRKAMAEKNKTMST
ncbi:hypothetical protein QTP88_010798 [Uroleucon formosanum]